jgi:endonuclease YncB( thermonuclease family)
MIYGFSVTQRFNTKPKDTPKAESVSLRGRAQIIDGDSLRIKGQEIRLQGIDAFEYDQVCGHFRCGQASMSALKRLTRNQDVTCTGVQYDQYDRLLAECQIFKNDLAIDLGAMQVRSGLAVAYRRYSERYVADEAVARDQKAGAWADTFEPPDMYRHR